MARFFVVVLLALFAMASAFKNQAKFVNGALLQQQQNQQQMKMASVEASTYDCLDNARVKSDTEIEGAPKCGFCMG